VPLVELAVELAVELGFLLPMPFELQSWSPSRVDVVLGLGIASRRMEFFLRRTCPATSYQSLARLDPLCTWGWRL